MLYNFSLFTTVNQCDHALVTYQGKRDAVAFDKAEREATSVSRASTSPLIPSRLASLQVQIVNATAALAAAQSPLDVSNAQINLSSLQMGFARLTKRSLTNAPEDILEDQLDIATMEQQIVVFEELIAALEARKAEILGEVA